MADEVRPAEGEGIASEGGQDPTGGLYDLDSVPQELRAHVEPHLKSMEANATKRFQDYADQLSGWDAYDELGIRDFEPEQLGQLLDFAELAQDRDQFANWWREVGERMDLFPADDGVDDDDLDYEDLSPADVRDIVQETVTQALAPINQSLEASENERFEAEIEADIHAELEALKEAHGEDIDTDAILKLAYSYIEDDPDGAIARGFEDYSRLVGKGEAGLFEQKARQPSGAEGPGAAATTPEPITSFDGAKAAARERLRQAQSV